MIFDVYEIDKGHTLLLVAWNGTMGSDGRGGYEVVNGAYCVDVEGRKARYTSPDGAVKWEATYVGSVTWGAYRRGDYNDILHKFCTLRDKGVVLPHAKIVEFRDALLAVWNAAMGLQAEGLLFQDELGREELASFNGAAKDVLLGLGLRWDSASDRYTFEPDKASVGKAS